MTNILLICNDLIGEKMAGPGIRYWEMGQALRQHFHVTLAIPPFLSHKASPSTESWVRLCSTTASLREATQAADIVITLGIVPYLYPFLAKMNKPLVIDLYDPFLLEILQRPRSQETNSYRHYLEALRIQLLAGDFFICAGEKQRDYWLGMLSAMGRINPYTYQDDPSLRKLIDVVPFGLPNTPPQHHQQVLKGVHRAIAKQDKVLLWGGGIWEWFDALTLIRAMPIVLRHRDDVKLFFMGIRRPTQSGPLPPIVQEAITLSQSLGLYNSHIFFNDWVPYEARQNYLLEADIGISLHREQIEARFAFRTRLLDYLWAGLPIITTQGDVLGEQLAKEGLATLVPFGDTQGVAEAILSHLQHPLSSAERQRRIHQAISRYQWGRVLEPLMAYCHAPTLAPDKAHLTSYVPGNSQGLFQQLRAGWEIFHREGWKALLRQIKAYLRWRQHQR